MLDLDQLLRLVAAAQVNVHALTVRKRGAERERFEDVAAEHLELLAEMFLGFVQVAGQDADGEAVGVQLPRHGFSQHAGAAYDQDTLAHGESV